MAEQIKDLPYQATIAKKRMTTKGYGEDTFMPDYSASLRSECISIFEQTASRKPLQSDEFFWNRTRAAASSEALFTSTRNIMQLAHDLRLPLTAILANAEFLTYSKLSEIERIEVYQEVRSAVAWMNEMISSLLEWSKGSESLGSAVQNVAETVKRVIGLTSVKQEYRRISITHRHEGLATGWFDATHIERVLVNLVLNACQAVSPESGKIVISTIGTRANLCVRVWDNGPGIPAAIQESMFLPFVSHGKANGHGLGLAIAKTLIEHHGGEIYFDENCDTGTQFVVLIPFAASVATVPKCH